MRQLQQELSGLGIVAAERPVAQPKSERPKARGRKELEECVQRMQQLHVQATQFAAAAQVHTSFFDVSCTFHPAP